MRPRRTLLLVGTLGALLLAVACGAALYAAPAGLLPRNAAARGQWQAQQVRGYTMTVRWTFGSMVNGPWQLNVVGRRVVSGIDLETGKPLSRTALRAAETQLPVELLFEAIARELSPSQANTPQSLLARYLPPQLHDRLDKCAPPIPAVVYHPELGYPQGITVFPSPCFRAGGWTVQIRDLLIEN